MTADLQTFGFPTGYFVIRSVATNRLWDVEGDEIEDGTGEHLSIEPVCCLLNLATKKLLYGQRRRSPWSKVLKPCILVPSRFVDMHVLGLRMPEANNQVCCTITPNRTVSARSHVLEGFFH